MTIPTIAEIEQQIITAIEGKIGQTIPAFGRAFFRILAKGLAGVISLVYRFISWCLDQTQPATCNEFWLNIWGNRYEITRTASVAARLTAEVTGIDGTDILAGQLWKSDAGLIYSQESLATIASGSAIVTVKCLTSGSGGNLGNGIILTSVTPIAGTNNTATISSTLTTGEDRMEREQYRKSIMNRIAYPPQGGAIPDYVIWAKEVAGIVAAFVDGGEGDVVVYPLIAFTGISRVPAAPKIAEVLAYLTDPIRKPMGANISVLATTERTCAVTITSATINGVALNTAQKASVQDAITASLYAAYPDQYPDQVDSTATIDIGIGWDALRAIGATAATVAISISGIGGGPYVLPVGEIIKISGPITWA